MSITPVEPSASGTVDKVAKVTLAFWLMKICATTVGETGGDLVSMTLKVGYAVSSLILLAFFVITLIAQLRSKRFHPALYWLVILSTSTAGTTLSDFMDRSLGLGYATGATIIAGVLIAVLAAWRLSYGSLKVDHIREPGVETYWLAILASNTLGTALGDFLADTSGLGYLWSNALISGGIALIILAWKFTRMSTTVLFWIAFVLTRPFGATMGDLLTKSHAKGGPDLGTIGSTAALLGLLIVLLIATTADYRKGFAERAPRDPPRLTLKLGLISAAIGLVCLIAYIVGVALSGNVHTVIPGEIYRAGQPRPGLLDRMERRHGIRTVLNLRGPNPGSPWYDDEVADSRRLGIQHIDFRMSSKEELTPQEVRTLIAIMRDAPKPLLIHCAGGSDRTGLASAFYVAAVSKGGEAAAEDQLSLRFGHIALPNLDAYAMNRTFERMEPELGYPNS